MPHPDRSMGSSCALVTGASSGIGRELARILAREGHDLVIVARRLERLTALKEELEREHHVHVLPLRGDLTDPEAADLIKAATDKAGVTVSILVNNAGVGAYGDFASLAWEEITAMVQLNITALLHLTRLYLPAMLQQGQGRILNVGSVAGSLPGPRMAVYHATKAFVLSFSQALSQETKGTGVTVTCLCPGPTRTEFHERAHAARPRLGMWMEAATVARIGYQAMMAGRRVVNAGLQNAAIAQIVRFLPTKLLLWAVHRTNPKPP